MINKKTLVASFLIFLFLGTVYRFGVFKHDSSTSLKDQNAKNKISVVVSFYPLYFFASEIGKDKAEVRNITPSGSEPHDYELSTKDIALIENSQLFILNGIIETWGNKIKAGLNSTNITIIMAGEGLFTQIKTSEGKSIPDPHIWLSFSLAKKEVDKITEGFIKVDKENSAYYLENKKKLYGKLDKLDIEYKKELKNCKQKNIITTHASFGYLTNLYDLNQVAISGLSPDAEPSTKQMIEIVKYGKEQQIKYIFYESMVSSKLAETIAEEIGARILLLDPLEGISEEEIKQGKNYITVMENNLKNLKIALQCSN